MSHKRKETKQGTFVLIGLILIVAMFVIIVTAAIAGTIQNNLTNVPYIDIYSGTLKINDIIYEVHISQVNRGVGENPYRQVYLESLEDGSNITGWDYNIGDENTWDHIFYSEMKEGGLYFNSVDHVANDIWKFTNLTGDGSVAVVEYDIIVFLTTQLNTSVMKMLNEAYIVEKWRHNSKGLTRTL